MTHADVELFLARFSEAVRGLARDLIDAIGKAAPDTSRRVRAGWGCVAFTHPRVGYFCGVFPGEAQVRFGFEFGVLLDDPAGALTGAGSQLRYLVVRAGDAVPSRELRRFVEQATSLPTEASVRRMMVRELRGAT